MALVNRMRRQRAAWWEQVGVDEYARPLYADPVWIRCRWEERQEEFTDSNGNRLVSNSVVYPDRHITNGVLMLIPNLADGSGDLEAISDFRNPLNNVGAWPVRSSGKFPSLKNVESKTLYQVFL